MSEDAGVKERLFKVLNENGDSSNGGTGKWHTTRRWMPPIVGDLVPCKNGYHLCHEWDLVYWLGPTIWEATYRGERIDCRDKIVVREARLIRRLQTWNDRTARLFACDCAERALSLTNNPDPRSVNAIRVARLFADGKASPEELAAARDAARDAAWAAGDAEREWQTARLMEYLNGDRR